MHGVPSSLLFIFNLHILFFLYTELGSHEFERLVLSIIVMNSFFIFLLIPLVRWQHAVDLFNHSYDL